MKLWLNSLDSITLNVGNISNHTFNMDVLCCVKARGLLKNNAHQALY